MDFTARSYNVTSTVSGTKYTLYTCPPQARARMVLLFVVNVTGNNTVSVLWERADTSISHVLGGKNMTAGEFIQLSDGYIMFEPGDKMTVTVTGTPNTDVLCTVEEFYKPSRPLG